MNDTLITIPTVRDTVDQNFFLEPLGGPKDVFYYLDRFPEEVYHKSPDSHLYKFMRAMLGENGVNWIRKNHLEARLKLEEIGIDLFDLDKFFGNIFQFGRIVEESFDEDPFGLIDKETWEQIKAKNSRYRNRALDFINGARAGNTPFGMRLVAKAGVGHDVEIIENYKYLYDSHSDDPLGLPYFGRTFSTEEMIVLPRREVGETDDSYADIATIPPADLYHLQQAVDRIRPMTSIITVADSRGQRSRIQWNSASASSEYTEVLRYVTGSPTVLWPKPSPTHPTLWIEGQVEKQAPRVANDLQHHYTGFHDISNISATSTAWTTTGPLSAERALADYTEPLLVTSATELSNGSASSFINGIYPTEYQNLHGVPRISYTNGQYWSSIERTDTEELIISFESPQAVNYLSFDIGKAPLTIDIEYDAYDEDVSLFVPVKGVYPYNNTITSVASIDENPWLSLGLTFTNSKDNPIFTKAVKVRFTRLGDYSGSIQVKNLRAARSV